MVDTFTYSVEHTHLNLEEVANEVGVLGNNEQLELDQTNDADYRSA